MLLVDRAALLVFAGLPALSLHRNQLTGEILAELSHLPEGPVEEFALDFAHFANGASIHLARGRTAPRRRPRSPGNGPLAPLPEGRALCPRSMN